ncbi:MAG: SPOR domain-containing protein [Gammaproteobacteria bacterium]|nr:SPOR domain-containing protein [Gammaproteobacteria bacterium]
MDNTIKIIRGLAIGNVLVFGLAACSSTPAPWTQTDESPWEETQASEKIVEDSSLNDPVLLADPEPELIVLQEPEMEEAPEIMAVVVVEELTVEQEIMALAETDYAVQVFASKSLENIERFKSNNDLAGLTIVKTDLSGSMIFVLVDLYSDRETANKAAADLEMKMGATPWVRSVAGLQSVVMQ